MKKSILFIALILAGVPLSRIAYSEVDSESINRTFIAAAERARPSVVNISVYLSEGTGPGKTYKKTADGTGTIITTAGHIVTNCHVVEKGDYYRAVLFNNRSVELERINGNGFYYADFKTDIAVLKIANSGYEKYFKPVTFADQEGLREGEWVLAIGNPYGLRQSITGGIVSSTGRNNIGFADIEDFIQSDVSINPGNSGGPLVNLKGEMVGLNSAIRTVSGGFQGISFAIPVSIVRHVSSELIRYGKVRRGWLGIIAKEVPSGTDSNTDSVEIMSVVKNSPAQAAGLKAGDIIRTIDGNHVMSLNSLLTIVGKKPVGSRIAVEFLRDRNLYKIKLVLREKEHYNRLSRALERIFRSYGIEVDEDSADGRPVITNVYPGSFSGDLKKGDTLSGINRKRVQTLDDFVRVAERYNYRIYHVAFERNSMMFEFNKKWGGNDSTDH